MTTRAPGMPNKVRMVEVGPRDGLQNEKVQVTTSQRIELIKNLADCGLTSIEAGSFVSPKWVPQMADTADVLAALPTEGNIEFPVLVPNMKGYEAAIKAGATVIAVFAAASESFSRRNTNCSIEESIERLEVVCAAAGVDGIRVRGYVSCVLGCPYEGHISSDAVYHVTRRLLDIGCYEVSLGDTIGTGTAGSVRALLDSLLAELPVSQLAVHFHDTYGQALANILVALELGISVVDSSVAGLGGCPYAKGATGNVATEDVVYMLNGLGIETGVDFDHLIDTAAMISSHLGRPPASRVSRAILAKRSG